MIAIAPQTNTQTIRQLQGLGYGPGDQVWVRLLAPKKLPMDVAAAWGMTYIDRKTQKPRISIPDGYLTLQADGQPTFTQVLGKSGKTRTYKKGLDQLQEWNKNYGVYFVVNPGGREDDDISQGRFLFYEADDISKEEQWERLRRIEGELGNRASNVVETGRSLHGYFELFEPIETATWKQYQQRLIQAQDSDPSIFNPARLMRLAGFDHLKWNEEKQTLEATPVRIVQSEPTVFSLEQFDRVLPAWEVDRWAEKPKGDRLGNGLQSFSTANFSSALGGGGGVDMRELAPYLEAGREDAEWDCYRCPNHNGVSDDSLHVRKDTGAYVCHGGCDSKDVYRAALDLAKSRGFVVPHVERVPTRQPDHAFLSHLAEVERVEDAQAGENLLQGFARQLAKAFTRKERKSRRSQPIPVTVTPRQVLIYGVDEIPTRQDWDGVPFEVAYGEVEQRPVWTELQRKGWEDILDTSAPGLGKSSQAGFLSPSHFSGIDGLVYVHGFKEADTKSLECWPPVPARTKDNCHKADEFQDFRDKNISTIDPVTGKNSPCMGCAHLFHCHSESGPGYGQRYERRMAMIQPRVRMHPSQIVPKDQAEVAKLAIIDEAGSLLDPVTRIKASRYDILTLLDDLETEHPELFTSLGPVLEAVKKLVKAKQQLHGLPDAEVRAALGPVPANIADILQAVDAATPTAADIIQERDRVIVEGLSSSEKRRIKSLELLIDRYPDALAAYTALEQRYGVIRPEVLAGEEKGIYRDWEKHFSNGRIEDLKAELSDLRAKKLQAERDRKTARKMARKLAWEQTQAEHEEIKKLPVQWLLPFLQVWSGEPGAMRIDGRGLHLTQVNYRQRAALGSFAARLYLDGTAKPSWIARVMGINPDEIVVCRQVAARPKNLRTIQIKDFGLLGGQRSDSLLARQRVMISSLKELHPDIPIFDKKTVNFEENKGLDGWWFRHNRGSNAYRDRSAIAAFGTPIQNVGALQDAFYALEGQWGGSEFDQWVLELTQAEFLQFEGRLRARQRPAENLTCYIFSDFPLPEEMQAEQMASIDLCPQAATDRDRTQQTVINAVVELMKEGVKVTQEAIADKIGKVRSWVSDLINESFEGGWKAFKALCKADPMKIVGSLMCSNNSFTDILEGRQSIDEEEAHQAEVAIPEALAEMPLVEVPKLIARVINARSWDSWLSICCWLDDPTRTRLLAGMFTLIPGGEDWLMEQLESLQNAQT